MITGSNRLLNFIDGKMKIEQIIWKATVKQNSIACPRSAQPNGQHTTPLLFLVHVSSNVRRGPGDGWGISEPAEAADRHLPSRQCWGLSCQPSRALGTRHRHPESTAAGLKPKVCTARMAEHSLWAGEEGWWATEMSKQIAWGEELILPE